MSYPEHIKESFFKYTTASTAIKILESSTVRYSSPLMFNDPFDVQSGLHFSFDIESLPEKILQRFEDLIASDTKPTFPEDNPWGQAVSLMWEKKATHGFPKQRFGETSRPLFAFVKEQTALFQSQYQQAWNDFLPRLRVFSIAEERDNLLMWSHYGQSHTGVVFEFRVLPEEDNPLCVAEPVIYRKAPLPLFREEQLLEIIFGLSPLDTTELYYQYARVKSDVWEYEREWRVWDLLRNREEPLHSDYPLRTKEIGAVYLGCKIATEDKKTIVSLVSNKYPEAKLFQAQRAVDEYRLRFDAM